jgi:hypothetical protein
MPTFRKILAGLNFESILKIDAVFFPKLWCLFIEVTILQTQSEVSTLETWNNNYKNKCKYIYIYICFILVLLNVQYSMFLKSLLAKHVSDVTASIVRSTTVVYSHRFFLWKIGVFSIKWCGGLFYVALFVLKISFGIYVFVCVLASVFVLRGFDVWSLHI